MKADTQTRTYKRSESVIFSKTKEAFGGLSNMAAGFPLRVNGVRILTSEALYQACRFPHRPEVQRLIISEASPMTAKMKSKPYRQDSRPDWDRVRVKIMRWCLRVKLAQNWNEFSRLLLATRERPIVEESRKDDFWGAKVADDETLVGMNVLGRLLMELREEVKQGDRERLSHVEPLDIPDFRLYGEPIAAIEMRPAKSEAVSRPYKVSDSGAGVYERQVGAKPEQSSVVQASLFDSEQQLGANVLQSGELVAALGLYPDYKESDLPWLGRIPKHWSLRRMKFLFRERKQKGFPNESLLAATQSKGVVRKVDYGSRTVTAQKDLHLLKLVEPGDFVISLRSFEGGIEISHARGIISPAYTVLSPRNEAKPDYYRYFFKSPHFIQSLTLFVTGIREGQNIDYVRLSRAYMPVPPFDEQQAMGRFLDFVSKRIERAIRAKRKVIALLYEQKQAIIRRAVTRGLDPNVRLKSSGVSWLGDIPAHWQVTRIKNEFRCLNSRRIPLSSVERGKMTVRRHDYYGASGVIDKVDDFTFEDELLLIAEDGANLVLRNLPLAIIARGRFWVNNHAHILKPKHGNIEYLAGLMETLNYQPWISGAAQPKLTKDRLMSIAIAIAPSEEQDRIVEHFTEQTAPLRDAIVRAEKEIALIREYRTRVIADVVTGKLDVCETARHLPIEIEETEPASNLVEIEEEGIEELTSAEGGDE